MKDFLSIGEYSPQALQEMLDLAIELKKEYQETGSNPPLLKDKNLGMIFQKPSLRTRVSFERGMQHLGGLAMYIGPAEIGLGKRESVADVARVMAGYVDGIMARVFDHQHVVELAEYASVPVINGLSDYNHPCQAMAESGSQIRLLTDPHEAVKDADAIYTDTWTSMGQEEEAARREKVFPPYQVNEQLVSEGKDHAIVLHCLPAHRNHEITDAVADGPHSRLFPQAHNRMHAQKAILVKLMAD